MGKVSEGILKLLPARFKPGQGVRGPDWYGCYNTGTAPVVQRSKFKDAPTFYLVGSEMAVSQVNLEVARDRIRGGTRRVYGKGRDRVVVFKGRKPAVAAFLKLAEAAAERNDREAVKVADLRRKAAEGDMQAALDLADWV